MLVAVEGMAACHNAAGSYSVENVFTLFAFKLLYPGAVHLNRGNHETKNMNKVRESGRG